MGDLWQLSKVI